ncbi:MAG: glycosyltransferase family 4 protein [Candidatus Eremiobacteraeota bacterium]|nr:glycosyltransferase family 4 protein [Candidatus Eremiobacteraeota bacterium]
MRVAIDAQLAVGTATGIGEYVRGLITGLRARGLDVSELQRPTLDPWRFDRRVFWDQILLPAAARRTRADLLHCTAGTMPFFAGIPTVVTVHDVAWFKSQAHTRYYARYYFGAFSLGLYRRARQIVVDSEFSRSELLQFHEVPAARVRVVYPGVAEDYCRVERHPDVEPFILSVGTVEARKNLEVIIRALRDIPNGVRLVVAGPPTPYEDDCKKLAAEYGVEDRIVWRGYVERNVLLDLFARAVLLVMPSKYEGFGYGAAQALCAGVPLLVSNSSSLPEVVEGEAPALPCGDVQAWVTHINAILNDRETAERRAAAIRHGAITRFAWTASIARMCEVYQAALD